MKIGLIGYGYWGSGYVARNIARVADLAVIVDPDATRVAEAASAWGPWGTHVSTDIETAFRLCDAVWIANPVDAHTDVVREAIDAGCHVMCEKPFVTSLEDSLCHSQAAEEAGLALMIGHLSLYTGQHEVARDVLGTSEEVHQFVVRRLTDRSSRSDNSVLWGLGPHDVAALVDLVGEPELAVWHGNSHRVTSTWQWSNGSTAEIELDWLCAERRREFSIGGYDLSGHLDITEPLLAEAQAFVELCSEEPDGPERLRHRGLAVSVTRILESADSKMTIENSLRDLGELHR